MMKDKFDREIRSFRISVTPECNLKCFYCHREGHNTNGKVLMTPEEIGAITKTSLDFGVKKIKISGGEPLLRKDIVQIVENIRDERIKDISLTTNGVLLEKYAEELKNAGLDRVNVSLDTLDPELYGKITCGNLHEVGDHKIETSETKFQPAKQRFSIDVERTKKGIEKAIEVGLTPLKVNFLAMDININHLDEIMDYCRDIGAILQIIEFIPTEENLKQHHVDIQPIEEMISNKADKIITRKFMQNRKKYIVDDLEIEFVRPMDNTEFCSHCTRIRLTYDGFLKPCLLRDDNLVDVLTPLRNGEDIKKYFEKCINTREPYFKH